MRAARARAAFRPEAAQDRSRRGRDVFVGAQGALELRQRARLVDEREDPEHFDSAPLAGLRAV